MKNKLISTKETREQGAPHPTLESPAQAIVTKYIPASSCRGSRVKAWCERGAVTLEWSHGYNAEENHRRAIAALITRLITEDEERHPGKEYNPWARPFIMGALPESIGGYVATFPPRVVASFLGVWRRHGRAIEARDALAPRPFDSGKAPRAYWDAHDTAHAILEEAARIPKFDRHFSGF